MRYSFSFNVEDINIRILFIRRLSAWYEITILWNKEYKKTKGDTFVSPSAVWTGLEPATPCVTGMYSNQLNYQTIF